jgi:hypothetical protein
MPLIREDSTEDVFNYVNPDYLKRLTESPECAADLSDGMDTWVDLVISNPAKHRLPRRAEFTYEGPEQVFVAWQLKAPALAAWPSVLLAPRTATEEALVGSPSELATILAKINDLAFEDEQDQFGPIRPTYDALKNCLRWILELAAGGRLLQPSDITTDHNGDIRISWTKGNREAELVSPSDGQSYLYFSSKETYGTDAELTADKISEGMRWALEG